MSSLLIIRGLPGSGKTTAAKELLEKFPEYKHFEADMYFMENGIYKFDILKIKKAHQWCQSQVKQALLNGYNVIVSNTFVKQWEMKPYFDMCIELNCPVGTMVTKGNYESIHNVPQETIDRMKANWEDVPVGLVLD